MNAASASIRVALAGETRDRLWQELEAPYDAAKIRLLLARASRALGDEDAAALELDAARVVFERLGAALDTRTVTKLLGRSGLPGGLTDREAEVLRLVAAGNSNREIAAVLVLSDKTVARHLSNIYRQARAVVAHRGHGVRLRARPRVDGWLKPPIRDDRRLHRSTDARPPRAS